MQVKAGVLLDGVKPQLLMAAYAYDVVRQYLGWGEGTITSGRDGGDGVGPARKAVDPHDYGLAVDLRTTDIPAHAHELAVILRFVLNYFIPGGFVVVEEFDHIHVQLANWKQAANVA